MDRSAVVDHGSDVHVGHPSNAKFRRAPGLGTLAAMTDEVREDTPTPDAGERSERAASAAAVLREGDPIEEAWAAVEASWDSPEAHKKFLVLCDTLDRLAEAGQRYRRIKETDPARRAEASKRIDELLGFAMARVKVDKVEPAKVRSRVEWIALGVSIVLVTAAVVSMMRMLGQ